MPGAASAIPPGCAAGEVRTAVLALGRLKREITGETCRACLGGKRLGEHGNAAAMLVEAVWNDDREVDDCDEAAVNLIVNFSTQCDPNAPVETFVINAQSGWRIETNPGSFSLGDAWASIPVALRAAATPRSDGSYVWGTCSTDRNISWTLVAGAATGDITAVSIAAGC